MEISFLYKVAGLTFRITSEKKCESWKELLPHYEPFLVEQPSGDIAFAIDIRYGSIGAEALAALSEVCAEPQSPQDNFQFSVYRSQSQELVFAIRYPQQPETGGWIIANSTLNDFRILINNREVGNERQSQWLKQATITTSALLCFMLGSNAYDTLTMHSSCVVKDHKAYLFLGKSGTGKSTHARLWLKNIAETFLLNDDHPIIRINSDGRAIAYGSPWSGKTDCYVNDSAEIGGIVKIEQAPHNKIRQLPVIEAYSKLMVSASGMTWFEEMAAARHKTIEQLLKTVPCYELECLPDDGAALLCEKTVRK